MTPTPRRRIPSPALPALLAMGLALSGAVPQATAAAPELLWETTGFSTPESVVFDRQRQVFYVSNMASRGDDAVPGDGFISRLAADGTVLEQQWVTGLQNPKGLVLANGRLLPNLGKRGLQLERMVGVDVSYSYFGMENPVVGGYTPDKVALRRALSLAYDVHGEITLVRQGQGVPAQAIVPPQMPGYEASFKSEMSEHDVGKALALLDLYGYTDHDGDGWRDQPDGSPLVIEYAAQPDQQSRLLQEQWQCAMNALKIRIKFKLAKWPEQLKSSRAGKLMMWGVNWSATVPDASDMLGLMYGPNKGQSNHARFDLPAYNTLYERQSVLPDGPEREALIHDAKKLGIAYMPYKISAHRIVNDVMQPWVFGYRRHPYLRGYWQYLDIDPALRARSLQP